MLLEGRVALVTGAARGIGRVTALVLAEEGADVALADVLGDVEAVAAEVRSREVWRGSLTGTISSVPARRARIRPKPLTAS